MSLRLEDDRMCFVCGKENPHGLRLVFEHPRKGVLRSQVVFSKQHQGFKNLVHGGMMATVLDEMMVNLAWKEGIPAVTAHFEVRLKKAARIGEKIDLEGRLEEGKGRLLRATSVAKDSRGRVLAAAKATCMRVAKPEGIVLDEDFGSS